MRQSKGRAQGGVKNRTSGATQSRKGKAIDAVVSLRQASRRQNQVIDATSAYMLYSAPMRRTDNKFFDPWVANGLKPIIYSTEGAVSNSAGGYVLNTAATPSACVINQIPQGTTTNSRLGRKARITGVYIKGVVQSPGAVAAAAKCTLALVHQLPPNNATQMPAFTDIWTAQHCSAQRNVDNNDKFKVIRAITVDCMGNAAAPATGKELINLDEMIDLKGKEIITEWTAADTTGVYGNMERGALHLYALANVPFATGYVFQGTVRVYFEDY
ncbi:coat protein [Lake Sarah-associated circular virus-47]|uniref:coat protein n=1 Tax=Lake Sarah-associated circular virus-47 TaxID=1685776 RepID=UPI000777A6F8|nr:coat protein [Lake Sarah-associated circular virus-47]ALE29802.1 coat protein [Lake Sarah-associated circular virus-47]